MKTSIHKGIGMQDVLQRKMRQDAVSALAQPGAEEIAELMLAFLTWLEHNKGLTLCHAFKPQYDWYMPAFANKDKLAREFLGQVRIGVSKHTQREHLA